MKKVIKNIIYLSLAMVFSLHTLEAQPYGKQEYDTMMEIADLALAEGDYYRAQEWFEKAYKEQKTLDVAIVLARLDYELRNYKYAEKKYKSILKRDKNNELIPEILDYANTLKAMGKYNDAIEQYLKYLDLTDDEEKKKVVYNELKGIKLLDGLAENLEAIVKPLPKEVNSGFAEYSPAEYSDGSLYYASYNRKEIIELNGEEEDYHSKIFTTRMSDKEDRKGNKKYEKPSPLDEEINRKGFHTANVAFSDDGNEMFFNRITLQGNDPGTSEIYVSSSKGDGWGAANAVEGVNGEYMAKHPMPGELFGNEVLFFSANMDGGQGGFDIYYSTKNDDGSYSTPNNLGEEINSSGDDVSPFYKDGTLYFSTNGHPSIGGYDIYYATWDGSDWNDLTNMGNNYNTSFDDLYFRMNNSGSKGYLVSNRPYAKKRKLKSETCCDDIFSVEIRELVIDLLAYINNEEGPLEGATAEVYDLDSEDYPQTRSEPNASDYNFILDADRSYKLVVYKDGYFPDSLEFNTAGILDDYTVKKTITLKAEPKKPSDVVEETELVTINQPIRMNNIYYDFDDDKILVDAEQDLNQLLDLMNKYPDMVIELSSHTDAQGENNYNQELSQRRAESATNWLLNKGVSKNRIVPKGYGEELILNECIDGVECDDSLHRQNRRTEFKIIAGPQFIQIKKNRPKPHNGGKQSFAMQDPKPIITFAENNIELGQILKGEKMAISYSFTNTGNANLDIELVTACKCTELEWTTRTIGPGEQGIINAIFDTSEIAVGKVEKTIDIIANTDPIVVEAFFSAEILGSEVD